MAGEQLGNN